MLDFVTVEWTARAKTSTSNKYFNRQNKGIFYYFKNEQNRLNKKMEWLLFKKIKSDLEKI